MKLDPKALRQFAKFGKQGGKKRMAALTDEEKRELASKAGKASAKARKRAK